MLGTNPDGSLRIGPAPSAPTSGGGGFMQRMMAAMRAARQNPIAGVLGSQVGLGQGSVSGPAMVGGGGGSRTAGVLQQLSGLGLPPSIQQQIAQILRSNGIN